jgi:uncharacterized protein with HEPN domain
MPPRDWRDWVEDIILSVQNIEEDIAGLEYDAFASDRPRVRSVEFSFIVIGEAARLIPKEVADRHPEVPWPKLREMRDVIANGYANVRLDSLWGTIKNDLTPLAGQLGRMLEAER